MSIAKHFENFMAEIGDTRSWQQKVSDDFARWSPPNLYEFALLDTGKEKTLGIIATTKEEREVLKRLAITELESRGIPREQWIRHNSALN